MIRLGTRVRVVDLWDTTAVADAVDAGTNIVIGSLGQVVEVDLLRKGSANEIDTFLVAWETDSPRFHQPRCWMNRGELERA